MNQVTIKDSTERWVVTLSGNRGCYRLEANFDCLRQKALFGALEKEYEVHSFARTNVGSVVVFHDTKKHPELLIEKILEIFANHFTPNI